MIHTWKMSDTASLNTLLWVRGSKPWDFRWGDVTPFCILLDGPGVKLDRKYII